MNEHNEFEAKLPKLEERAALDGQFDLLDVREEKDKSMALGFGGTPPSARPWRQATPDLVRLRNGDWARLTVNARHTGHEDTYYTEDTFNVVWGESLPPDVFLRGQPDHLVDLKVDLF